MKVMQLLADLGRPALHAKSLGFTHPITGDRLQFTSDLPQDFEVQQRCRRSHYSVESSTPPRPIAGQRPMLNQS